MGLDLDKQGKAASATTGEMGQIHLARGTHLAMRMWNEPVGEPDRPRTRSYETVGYVLEGRVELTIQGEKATLKAGDSWIVPAGAEHAYRVLEPLRAIEATSPPAQDNAEDRPPEE